VSNVYETWFSKQNIDVDQYQASFRPHAGTYPWSLIFVIGVGGAFGEMVTGQHAQLTHGDTLTSASTFKTDFSSWEWRNEHAGARDIMIRALDILHVTDEDTRAVLEGKLDATFTNNHLDGYYEAILWGDDIIRFGDYNRVLQKRIPVPAFLHRNESALAGMVASVGTARGIVRIVEIDQIGTVEFNTGDILVTDNTDVRFVGLMQKAGAIVTDRGGILSHASIVARELKKPCIVGTGNATTILKNGDFVEVDAFTGVVNILTKG
jgi:phosphohistidine swiveling domain-containing protein